MRLKNSKKRSAYRRGEKMIIILRRGIIVLSIIAFLLAVLLGVKLLVRAFHVSNIQVSGNYHLDEEDIINNIKIGKEESLFEVNFNDIGEGLKRDPWIKEVSLRKRFPDTLMIRIEEAIPKALLSLQDRMFLVDEDGNILEEIKNKSTPFLPVISEIDPEKNRKGFLEALKLIDALVEKNITAIKESIEISQQSYGPVMNIDGEIIKVGYGRYSEKLERWKELEPELRKRGPIRYIDLRFKDRVIVKPLRTAKK